ncbi:MAG: hypothetical protein GIW95_00780 [Candidatus Eremiobacteraeota bacterium]|nr:hypothetical protein [Candidatus Eremiobacteraeota bacterium]
MSPLFLAAAFAFAWERAGLQYRGGARAWPRLRTLRVSTRGAAFAALTLVGAYGLQLALFDYQSSHDGSRAGWFAAFPFHFVDDAYPFGPLHRWLSFEALGLVAAQTVALFALVSAAVSPARTRGVRVILCAAAAVLAGLSLWSPVVTSGDVFGYVGIGMLGAHPFDRPLHFFHGQYATVFAHYPIRPTIYGPVWVGFNAAIVALAPTFWTKIFALRVLGALLIVATGALASALGSGRAVRWAIFLNPMLWLQFVVNAHNDLLAVALALGGLLALRRKLPWLAIVLVAAAGLVKLPFLAVALVVFAFTGNPRRRLAYAAAAVALCLAASWLIGGAPYLEGLLFSARSREHGVGVLTTLAKLAAAALALAATALALFRQRFSHVAGWLYPALTPLLFPWYFVWTAAYALIGATYALETLLALPLAGVLGDSVFALDDVAMFVALGTLAAALIAWRRRRME